MGILTWGAVGAVAAALSRLVPQLRDVFWRGDLVAALCGAALGGLTATALDFGGLEAVDPRAIAFSFVTALLGVALYRLRYLVGKQFNRAESNRRERS